MRRYQRARIFNQGLVHAEAGVVWEFFTDWAGTKRGAKGSRGGDSPLAFSKVDLIGREDEVPRTRVFHFTALPTVRETLLYQNDDAMHLYYNIEGIGPLGLVNYLATTEVDPLGETLSQVTITARFDVAATEDIVPIKGLINLAHNSVIAAARAYLE